jgi:hypothetical protein
MHSLNISMRLILVKGRSRRLCRSPRCFILSHVAKTFYTNWADTVQCTSNDAQCAQCVVSGVISGSRAYLPAKIISHMLPLLHLFTGHNTTDQVLRNSPRIIPHLCAPQNACHAVSNAWDNAATASETNCFPIVSTLSEAVSLDITT